MLLFIILYKKINTLKTGDCCVNVYAVSNNNNNTEKNFFSFFIDISASVGNAIKSQLDYTQ